MFKIEKVYSRANIPKTIRFTEELDAKLTALASGENISFNELVLCCCQYALDNYEGNVDFKTEGKDTDD
jgi:predicted metal-binding transcription factor (methanogenesis marker protein 9)